MGLYSKKQRWKAFLLILALVIIGLSLWYSNHIVSKIRKEEHQKVELWSQAIEKRATLVGFAEQLFAELSTNEKKKVSLWLEATNQVNRGDLEDFTFVTKVIQDNTTIPMIVVDENGEVVFDRNIEGGQDPEVLQQELEQMKKGFPPMEVNLVPGEKQFLYYKDSRLFSELKDVMDDLINSFISETVINSASVPVILTDETRSKAISYGNVDTAAIANQEQLMLLLNKMQAVNEPIKLTYGEGRVNYIFYEDSIILTQLRYFPLVQFVVIGLFLLIAYLLFSTFRKAEQNQVWVGMAKETAHQLGTPLSALMAWMDVLEDQGVDKATLTELNKDVDRLEVITERFSKVGAAPKLEQENITEVLEEAVAYLGPRLSSKVKTTVNSQNRNLSAKLNRPLFGWVVENLTKNAVDAMEGEGELSIEITDEVQQVYIDISDTGKGIPPKFQRTIFQPGYTTKKRGWGLGLSLTKRIIENYHKGKIFVKRSEVGQGTTFRIVLNK